MTRRLLACTIVTPLVCGLGCQLPNPAFNTDKGDDADTSGTGGTNDTTAEGSTSVSTTGDGDGDETLDTGMTAPDTGGKLDMAVDTCKVPTNDGLRPRFGAPTDFDQGCLDLSDGRLIKVVGENAGDLVVNICETCSLCDGPTGVILAARPLQLVSIIPVPGGNVEPALGCYFVQAAQLVADDDAGCIYDSLTVHANEGDIKPVVFSANRQSAGLALSAANQLANWAPVVVDRDDVDQCPCEDLAIECCPNHIVVAKKFELGNNIFVYPGEDGDAWILQQPWNFFGAQAQSGVTCDPPIQTSWAIWPAE